MTPQQVKEYFGSIYKFNKATKMSKSSLSNWIKWGYVPVLSQFKLHQLTDGKLTASLKDAKYFDK